MLAALMADATSKMVSRGSLYHSLAEIAIERAGGGGSLKEAPISIDQ